MNAVIPSRCKLALALLASLVGFAFAPSAQAQSDTFFDKSQGFKPQAFHPPCKGKVRQVRDMTDESVRTTAWNFAMVGGGGEGGRFDPVPLLSAPVNLTQGCLNAHFSALVGSRIYPNVSNMTLFQVSLRPAGVMAPVHMPGHYETPYGLPAPALALSAEYDVDEFAANYYQGIGNGQGLIPPGAYIVDVWWAGGPTAPGGAIGAAFTLKLYQY